MKSSALPSFWTAYAPLDEATKRAARKAFSLFARNPFYPSLHFKCVNRQESVWSVRVSKEYRALGTVEGDTVTWFWIGGHDEYEQAIA
jgi:hypothetical protein